MSHSHLANIKSDSDESSVLSSEAEEDLPYDTIDISSPVYDYSRTDDNKDKTSQYLENEGYKPNLKKRNQSTLEIQQSDFYENSDDSKSDYDEITNTRIALSGIASPSYNKMVSSIVSAIRYENSNDKDSQFFNSLNLHRENDLSNKEFLLLLLNKENSDTRELLETIDRQREILNSGKSPSNIRYVINENLQHLYVALQSLHIHYRNDYEVMNKIQNKFKQWEEEKLKHVEKGRQIERNIEFTEKLETLNTEKHLVNTEIAKLEEKLQKLKERKSIINKELESTRSNIEIKKSEFEASYNAIEDVENKAIERLIEEEIVTLDFNTSLSQTNVVDNIKNALKRITFESLSSDERQINSRNLNMALQQINAHYKKSKDLLHYYKTESRSFHSKIHSCREVFETLSSNEQKIISLIKKSGELSTNATQIEQLFESSVQLINQMVASVQNSESPNNSIFKKIYKNESDSLLSSLKLINPNNKIFSEISLEPHILQVEDKAGDDNHYSLEITEKAIYHNATDKFISKDRILKTGDTEGTKSLGNKSYGGFVNHSTQLYGDKMKSE